jgi:hypothetical protein
MEGSLRGAKDGFTFLGCKKYGHNNKENIRGNG